jgi:TolB protein
LTYGGWSSDPDWSPDGQWIAYVIKDEIGLISLDGSKARILTYQPGGSKALPTWSPDGHFLAYLYYNPQREPLDPEVWVLEVQSGRNYRVATGAMAFPRTLSWSPDGQKIIFSTLSERDCKKLYSVENKENGRVEEINLSPAGQQEGMVWSPDGKWFAYAVSPTSTCTDLRSDAGGKLGRLFIAQPDDPNGIELLADWPGLDPVQPKWKPLPTK